MKTFNNNERHFHLYFAFIIIIMTTMTSNADAPLKPHRYLALGDSYTIGEGVVKDDRWPEQLAIRLRENHIAVSTPVIVARTGWTTGDLLKAIQWHGPQVPYDLITLLIGTNNQYQGRSIDEYKTEFDELLKRSVVLADGKPDRVVVLSLPDWGMTPFAQGQDQTKISADIDRFNAIARTVSERARVHFVDITRESRSDAASSGMFAADGLHPSGKMYAAWVRRVLSTAVDVLKR